MREPLPEVPGLYEDPSNGDMWDLDVNGRWGWVNGVKWSFVPSGLVRVGDTWGQTPRGRQMLG